MTSPPTPVDSVARGGRRTALITGASSGIGWSLAGLFAEGGHDLVLVARRAEPLQQLASELRSRHGVVVTVLPADLSVPGAAPALVAQLGERGLHVDILVNNAGFGIHGDFTAHPLDKWMEMIQLNITTLTALTYLLLPGMRARGFGRIANLSSVAGFQAAPSFAVYAATKAFVLSFSEALREELQPCGISVTAICPGATRTEFHQVAGHRDTMLLMFSASAHEVATESYRAIQAGRGTLVNGWLNKPLPLLLRFTPRSWAVKIAGRLGRSRPSGAGRASGST